MIVCYKETPKAKKLTQLIVGIKDAPPLIEPFNILIEKDKLGIYNLGIAKKNQVDWQVGGRLYTSFVIHNSTYPVEDIAEIKALIKNHLATVLKKCGLLNGISEEKVK